MLSFCCPEAVKGSTISPKQTQTFRIKFFIINFILNFFRYHPALYSSFLCAKLYTNFYHLLILCRIRKSITFFFLSLIHIYFIDAILNERHTELLAEGFRWFDLVRLNRLESDLGFERKYNKMCIRDRSISD